MHRSIDQFNIGLFDGANIQCLAFTIYKLHLIADTRLCINPYYGPPGPEEEFAYLAALA